MSSMGSAGMGRWQAAHHGGKLPDKEPLPSISQPPTQDHAHLASLMIAGIIMPKK